MSRKLDNHVVQALKDGDHESVYRDLATALELRFDDLLVVELLGPSHQLEEGVPFLRDENAIAIPKLRLIQAFLPAREILLGHTRHESQHSTEELLRATAVVLLMDPEHLTAANTRKRILLQNKKAPKDALLTEKYLIDSFLTSHLHRHTKSPTLWSHRKWLISRLQDAGYRPDPTEELKRIIFVSGERHPRNYYAWDHARFLFQKFSSLPSSTFAEPLAIWILETKKWCFHHHNDTSGWSFLSHLLQRDTSLAKPVFTEICGHAKSYHWRNESVWYFLRNLFRDLELAECNRKDFHHLIETLSSGLADDDEQKRSLLQTRRWISLDISTSTANQLAV